MRFNTLFLTLLINLVAVYAKKHNSSSFAVGASTFCKHDDLSKHDKIYYASVAKELMDESICDKYIVAMVADSKFKGKYKLVRALIRDECDDCDVTEIKLSHKALKDIEDAKKSNVFWGILSKEGEMITGPFQPNLSEKETEEIVNAYDGENIDDILHKFINNAKYMVKNEKTHLKKLNNVKVEVVKKVAPAKKTKILKTTVIETVITSKKIITHTKDNADKAAPTVEPTAEPTDDPSSAKSEEPTKAEPEETTETSNGAGIMTGAVAVSLAAGAALLLVHRKSSKKNYIFGEPLDKYDGKAAKELYAKTKSGHKIKLQIPYNDFNDIAHIQIFSPNTKEALKDQNVDVYNIHTERALMSSSSENSLNDGWSTTNPQPQIQPQPHSQLPIPVNDFMMAFSPIEQPDLAAIPKENIGAYDCTKVTSRFNDDPYLSQYRGDDDGQEIYNSVPQPRNRTSTDILLEYVEGEEY